jgi:hypothetical protein
MKDLIAGNNMSAKESEIMRNSSFLGIGLILGALLLPSPGHAWPLNVVAETFTCDQGKYRIKFGVVNRNTYDRNPTVAFKVLDGGRPVGCKQLTVNVPAGSDGSALQEITVDGVCVKGQATLEARVFDAGNRDRAGAWLSDCPR